MPPKLALAKLLTFVALGLSHAKSLLWRFHSWAAGRRRHTFLLTSTPSEMRQLLVVDDRPSLKDIIIDSGCKVLAELSDVTGTSSDEQQQPSDRFDDRRRTVMFTGSAEAFQNGFWLRKTKKVMKELNTEVQCIPSTAKGSFRFLDLGCCPGGFSAYILEKNKLARSLGISLPTESGGYSYCLDRRQRRETFLAYDLTRFDLRPHTSDPVDVENTPCGFKAVPREIKNRAFDLAILGATPLAWASNADEHRLLVSQIILGLDAVKNGGTLIVALHNPESPTTARILHLLHKLSLKLTVHKSSVVHQAKGSFFAVAQGVGESKNGEHRDEYLASFRTLWEQLTLNGGREMTVNDLDFIVSIEDISLYHLSWLVELCTKIWEIQLRAVESRPDSKDSSFSSFSSSTIRDMSFSSL